MESRPSTWALSSCPFSKSFLKTENLRPRFFYYFIFLMFIQSQKISCLYLIVQQSVVIRIAFFIHTSKNCCFLIKKSYPCKIWRIVSRERELKQKKRWWTSLFQGNRREQKKYALLDQVCKLNQMWVIVTRVESCEENYTVTQSQCFELPMFANVSWETEAEKNTRIKVITRKKMVDNNSVKEASIRLSAGAQNMISIIGHQLHIQRPFYSLCWIYQNVLFSCKFYV